VTSDGPIVGVEARPSQRVVLVLWDRCQHSTVIFRAVTNDHASRVGVAVVTDALTTTSVTDAANAETPLSSGPHTVEPEPPRGPSGEASARS